MIPAGFWWGAAALSALGVSARWNWWRPAAEGLPVLMYHKVGDPPPGSRLKKLWVSVAKFRRQMEYLKTHGYQPATFAELAEDPARFSRPVVLSFDDGYLNNYQNAFPLLREFGFRAVVFLVVDAIGKDNFWHDPRNEVRIPMLSREQILEMQAAGVEFGSHTFSHPRLSRLDDAAARREIIESRRALEVLLGRAPVPFAYPYGDGQDEPRLWKIVEEAGYRWACAIHQGKARPEKNPYSLRRIFVRGDDGLWDFHLNLTRGRARF
ncbi:MAG TPA: polysaccharide deacetylase family protein [Elusimicrobiota bacterium]|nr:polysaccharide deacetylase family protein [Elusimicrobiota bacterium]